MGRAAALILAALFAASAWAQSGPVDATTAGGEKVKLYPDGRWEYADPVKAEPQKKAREAELERERSSQGGLFGIGRRVQEGDKDYNRGTLNPARR
jgi:hypothetical protein